VPPSWTRQVAVPAGIAVALAPPLALAGEGRPWIAAVVSAVVFAVGTLAQQDLPTGRLVGALGSTAYVLAVGMALVRDVPLWHTFWAGVIGLATAVLVTAVARSARSWTGRHRGAAKAPDLPRLPGRFAARLGSAMSTAALDWRSNPFARLALRRVVVLTPLVAFLEAWRDPVALYSLIVAFSVTQPLAGDTLDRALARTAGVIGAIVTALGTTVLTVATGVLAGTSTTATNRVLATVAGAGVGILATALIPAPPPDLAGASAPTGEAG
jgi:hypothetical protein